jgi:hypothetical protein
LSEAFYGSFGSLGAPFSFKPAGLLTEPASYTPSSGG